MHHHAMSYHQVCESIGEKYNAVSGKMVKRAQQMWSANIGTSIPHGPLLKPLLFWRGEVSDLSKTVTSLSMSSTGLRGVAEN